MKELQVLGVMLAVLVAGVSVAEEEASGVLAGDNPQFHGEALGYDRKAGYLLPVGKSDRRRNGLRRCDCTGTHSHMCALRDGCLLHPRPQAQRGHALSWFSSVR